MTVTPAATPQSVKTKPARKKAKTSDRKLTAATSSEREFTFEGRSGSTGATSSPAPRASAASTGGGGGGGGSSKTASAPKGASGGEFGFEGG